MPGTTHTSANPAMMSGTSSVTPSRRQIRGRVSAQAAAAVIGRPSTPLETTVDSMPASSAVASRASTPTMAPAAAACPPAYCVLVKVLLPITVLVVSAALRSSDHCTTT